MCGRFSLTKTVDEIESTLVDLIFSVQDSKHAESRFNIAPTQDILIINQGFSVNSAKWGLIPHWSKDPKKYMINARSETIFEKPSFSKSIKERRCVILADGFYEWKKDLTTGVKTPYHFFLPQKELFGFAAIYEDASPLCTQKSASIITTKANHVVEGIHDRMPVILRANVFREWLENPQFDKVFNQNDTLLERCLVSSKINSVIFSGSPY